MSRDRGKSAARIGGGQSKRDGRQEAVDHPEDKEPAHPPLNLKRNLPKSREEQPPAPPPVSAGAVDKVIDLAFNPSEDKIREVTIVDRFQGRLLPQLDLIDEMWEQCIETASYRKDSVAYMRMFHRAIPTQVSPIKKFVYRTAQWQKSIAGKNLERATDIALTETETKANEGEDFGDSNPWKE